MTIETGRPAPDFALPASNGQTAKLSDFRGRYVVLYFYPKDMTPGCTTEACDFRDANAHFAEANAVILGISPDPVAEHAKFIAKYELPFLLLADEDHQTAEQYDVWKLKLMYGREYMGIERSTFIIDPQGNVVREWRKVKVDGHVAAALEYINSHEA